MSRGKAGGKRTPAQSFLSTLSDIRFIAHTHAQISRHHHRHLFTAVAAAVNGCTSVSVSGLPLCACAFCLCPCVCVFYLVSESEATWLRCHLLGIHSEHTHTHLQLVQMGSQGCMLYQFCNAAAQNFWLFSQRKCNIGREKSKTHAKFYNTYTFN